ncbi:MAG: CDP-alcohol phosphatidyltransferase family protein [Rhodospirillaceae bacterium]|nr:CDP-alcohol phosphatidyltransferase family protein [Rhodospirillaceae bacterium]
MMVWIDAASPAARLKIFGLTVTERHLQALLRLDPKPSRIVIDTGAHEPAALGIPAEVTRRLPITWTKGAGSLDERLNPALADSGGDSVLVLDGTALADQRLHGQLAKSETTLAVFAPDHAENAAMLFLKSAAPVPAAADLASLARSLVTAGTARELTQQSFDGFIRKLRRSLPFYLFRIGDQEAAAKVQRFLFWSNYKGSTDLFTRYVYPPLVWLMVRPLAAARIHPNLVTLVSIALTFGAVPFFASGQWAIGFLMAYGMSVLDSVDGKLARLTFTDSRLGNFLDHGLDMVHPPIWYVAWAYGIGLGTEGWGSPLGYATIAILVFYVLDRLILKIYPRFFQRGFHTHSKMDATVRSFIARRNINLPLFLLGIVFGLGREAFFLISAWQIATAAYHGVRTFWILAVQKAHRNPQAKPAHVAADLD